MVNGGAGSSYSWQDLVNLTERLRTIVRGLQKLYYQEDDSPVPDAHFDHLFRKLVEIEAAYPELVTEDSPTRVVGH